MPVDGVPPLPLSSLSSFSSHSSSPPPQVWTDSQFLAFQDLLGRERATGVGLARLHTECKDAEEAVDQVVSPFESASFDCLR